MKEKMIGFKDGNVAGPTLNRRFVKHRLLERFRDFLQKCKDKEKMLLWLDSKEEKEDRVSKKLELRKQRWTMEGRDYHQVKQERKKGLDREKDTKRLRDFIDGFYASLGHPLPEPIAKNKTR